jgi:Mn2+/Fe2+ NRAMP family transporter
MHTDNELLAFGLAMVALALSACVLATWADEWIAERHVRKAREAHEARKRLARGG